MGQSDCNVRVLLTDNECMRKIFVGLAATMVATGGLGLAGLGLASGTAQADIGPVPMYHWCPGDFWDQGWGFNFDWFNCHDDFHRDIDGDNHDRDWRGDQRGDQGQWQRGDQGPDQHGDQGQWQRGDQGPDQRGDQGQWQRGDQRPGQPWWPGQQGWPGQR
jgi:hypothetical protein